ncbi:hypothetical protein ACH5RR_040933 [Cinchona calisaya]|uniref:Uncharacterized protein n=1 Tax=Cinchona calisaya TaxID=153742 RepID=A0ABD2XSM6_9GENT
MDMHWKLKQQSIHPDVFPFRLTLGEKSLIPMLITDSNMGKKELTSTETILNTVKTENPNNLQKRMFLLTFWIVQWPMRVSMNEMDVTFIKDNMDNYMWL